MVLQLTVNLIRLKLLDFICPLIPHTRRICLYVLHYIRCSPLLLIHFFGTMEY